MKTMKLLLTLALLVSFTGQSFAEKKKRKPLSVADVIKKEVSDIPYPVFRWTPDVNGEVTATVKANADGTFTIVKCDGDEKLKEYVTEQLKHKKLKQNIQTDKEIVLRFKFRG